MAEQDLTNYGKIQDVSSKVSRLAQLEEAYREGRIDIAGDMVDLTEDIKNTLKSKFGQIRTEAISILNSITA